MSNIIEIRKATFNDVYSIKEIVSESFNNYVNLAGIKGTIPALNETVYDIENDINKKEVFVAVLNNAIVGAVRVEINDDKTAYLSRFAVKTDYQNIGIGKGLISSVDEHMQLNGIKRLYLHSASKVASIICFYYKNGFYIDSTTSDRGYIRALLCKEYDVI